MKRTRDQLIDHSEERPRPVGHYLRRLAMATQRRREEPSIGAGCPTCTFLAGTGAIPKPGSDCIDGERSALNKTITFNRPTSATGNWVGSRLAVTFT